MQADLRGITSDSDAVANLRERVAALEGLLAARSSGRVIECTSATRPTEGLHRGLLVWESDTGNVLQWYGATSGWWPMWDMPWGELGTNVATSNQSGFNTVYADVAGSGVTVSVPANRSLLYVFDAVLVQTTAAGDQTFKLFQGASDLGIIDDTAGVPVGRRTIHVSRRVAPAALDAVLFKVQGKVTAGNFAVSAGSTMNSRFSVYDMGPTGVAPTA